MNFFRAASEILIREAAKNVSPFMAMPLRPHSPLLELYGHWIFINGGGSGGTFFSAILIQVLVRFIYMNIKGLT